MIILFSFIHIRIVVILSDVGPEHIYGGVGAYYFKLHYTLISMYNTGRGDNIPLGSRARILL